MAFRASKVLGVYYIGILPAAQLMVQDFIKKVKNDVKVNYFTICASLSVVLIASSMQ